MNQVTQLRPAEGHEATPMEIIQSIVSAGKDIQDVGVLMDAQERWEARQSQQAFTRSMVACREELPKIIKTQKGHNVMYEDLAEMVDAITPILSVHGVMFDWEYHFDKEGMVGCSFVLTHEDGHTKRTTAYGPPDTSGSKNDIQAIGSTMTYLQRYTMKGGLGLAATNIDPDQARADQPVVRMKPADFKRSGRFEAFKMNVAKLETSDDLWAWYHSPRTAEALRAWPTNAIEAATDWVHACAKELDGVQADDDARSADDLIDEFDTVISGFESAIDIGDSFDEYAKKPAFACDDSALDKLKAARDARINRIE